MPGRDLQKKRATEKKWYWKNVEKRRKYVREYYHKHYGANAPIPYWKKEKRKKYIKEWRDKNKDKIRLYNNKSRKKRYQIDSRYRLQCCIAPSIRNALKDTKRGRKWEQLVGYTVDDLMKHLEAQFDDKMSWKNQGSYWHIDHIKPKSLFVFSSPEDPEFKECWALENLQPLEKIANIKKFNHYAI